MKNVNGKAKILKRILFAYDMIILFSVRLLYREFSVASAVFRVKCRQLGFLKTKVADIRRRQTGRNQSSPAAHADESDITDDGDGREN